MDEKELIDWLEREIRCLEDEWKSLDERPYYEPTEVTYINGKIMAYTQVFNLLLKGNTK